MITCENSSGRLKEAIKVKLNRANGPVQSLFAPSLDVQYYQLPDQPKRPMIGNRITFVRSNEWNINYVILIF